MKCSNPSCKTKPPSRQLKSCSRCHRAWYCDSICQLAHWTVHKTDCQVAMTPDDKRKLNKEICIEMKRVIIKACSERHPDSDFADMLCELGKKSATSSAVVVQFIYTGKAKDAIQALPVRLYNACVNFGKELDLVGQWAHVDDLNVNAWIDKTAQKQICQATPRFMLGSAIDGDGSLVHWELYVMDEKLLNP